MSADTIDNDADWQEVGSPDDEPDGGGEDKPKKAKAPRIDAEDVAQVLAGKVKDTCAYDAPQGTWRLWSGKHWQRVEADGVEMVGLAVDAITMLHARRSASMVRDTLTFARRYMAREFPEPSGGLVNFANGTLDVATGVIMDHLASDNLTYCLGYDYCHDPVKEAELWQLLLAIIPDCEAVKAYLAQIGLGVMRDRRQHKAVLLYGPTRSGKSTLMALANAACGYEPFDFADKTLFSEDGEGMRHRAKHATRLIACADEIKPTALHDEDMFKKMVAHSGVYMRGFQQAENGNSTWRPKIMMTADQAPRFNDNSGAMRERLVIAYCPFSHPEAEGNQNTHLIDELIVYLPQLLAMAIAQAREVIRTERWPVSVAMAEKLETIARAGNLMRSFVDEECEIGKDAEVRSRLLYAAYRRFYERVNPSGKVESETTFVSKLTDMIPTITSGRPRAENGSRYTVLKGIGLPAADDYDDQSDAYR